MVGEDGVSSFRFLTETGEDGFQGNQQNPFLKITVTDPKYINRVRTTIKDGNANWKGMWKNDGSGLLTFDNIQYVMRFMVDCKVCGTFADGDNV